MTSVQNLLPPSSGSNLSFVLLILFVMISGCAIFNPATSRKDAKPETKEEMVVDDSGAQPVDTIDWTVRPETEVPPITDRKMKLESVFKDAYNVVLVAPFGTKNFQGSSSLNSRSSRMLEFYAGLKYAWRNHNEGVEINLSVIDSDKDPNFVENFDSYPEFESADIIIGPYFTQALSAVAEYAKQNQKILLSPWNTTSVTSNNPFFIQLRPNLRTHAQALTRYLETYFAREKTILLCQDNFRDSTTLTYFHEAHIALTQHLDTSTWKELKVADISDPDLSEQLTRLIDTIGYHTFIVPNWSDQPFVISALAKINYAKADEEVTVFGLPQWMTMSKMDYNYYENLNVHVSTEAPLDFNGIAAKNLKQHFFSTYGTLPSQEVYYGMDVLRTVCYMLKQSGTLITQDLSKLHPDTNYDFDFISVFAEDGETIDHHENRFIQIAKFEDFRFVTAD